VRKSLGSVPLVIQARDNPHGQHLALSCLRRIRHSIFTRSIRFNRPLECQILQAFELCSYSFTARAFCFYFSFRKSAGCLNEASRDNTPTSILFFRYVGAILFKFYIEFTMLKSGGVEGVCWRENWMQTWWLPPTS